jgi:hypothetical protein
MIRLCQRIRGEILREVPKKIKRAMMTLKQDKPLLQGQAVEETVLIATINKNSILIGETTNIPKLKTLINDSSKCLISSKTCIIS